MAAPDLEIRDAGLEDRDAVRRVVASAFGDEGERNGRLIDALDESGHTRASLVAEVDDAVIGHVQLSRSWLDAREGLVEVLVLSPLCVAPDHQGRGVGAALVSAAVSRADEVGAPAVFLEGDPGYYSRHGFELGAQHGFVRPSVRIPEPAFQVVVLSAHEPWMTGALVYCEPFWALDCVGLRDPLLEQIEQTFEQ